MPRWRYFIGEDQATDGSGEVVFLGKALSGAVSRLVTINNDGLLRIGAYKPPGFLARVGSRLRPRLPSILYEFRKHTHRSSDT